MKEIKQQIDNYLEEKAAAVSRLKEKEIQHVEDLEQMEKEVSEIMANADSPTRAQSERLSKLSAEIQAKRTILDSLNQMILRTQGEPGDPIAAERFYVEIQREYDRKESDIEKEARQLLKKLKALRNAAAENYQQGVRLMKMTQTQVAKETGLDMPNHPCMIFVRSDSPLLTLSRIFDIDNVKRLLSACDNEESYFE